MIPTAALVMFIVAGIPRESGDDPTRHGGGVYDFRYSPRERG